MDKGRISAFLACLSCLLLVPVFVSCSGNYDPDNLNRESEIVKLTDWQYLKGDLPKDTHGNYIFINEGKEDLNWTSSSGTSMFPVKEKGNVMWLRTRLPESLQPASAVFVNRALQMMSVYLDGRKIYDNSSFISDTARIQALEFRWYMVKLPVSFTGEYLYFRFYSEGKEIGMPSPVSLGTADNFLSQLIRDNTDDMVIGAIVIMCGIIMLMVFILFQRNRLYFALTVFFLDTGLFICVNNPYINLLTNNTYLVYFLDSFALLLMPVLFLAVSELVLDKYRKYLRLIWKIHLAYIIGALIAVWTSAVTIKNTEDPFFVILLLSSNMSLALLFKSVSRKRVESLILLIATIIFSAFGTAEIFLFYFNYYSSTWYTTTYVLHWGVFSFAVSMIILVSYKYLSEIRQKEEIQEKVLHQQQLAIEAVQREISSRERFTKQLIESQDNERKRIARELHDAIGQELLIIKNMALLSLKAISREPVQQEKAAEYINDVSDTTSSVIENVRSMSRNLHPYQLDNLGLTDSLEAIINRVAESTGICFNTRIDLIDRLFERDKEVHVYRIVQEAINNIIKHSEAEEAGINITRNYHTLDILISDNGKGFPVPDLQERPSQPDGFGISGIYERVSILGGSAEFRSEAGKGTSIFIKLPLSNN